jgi:hypothetical protein
MTAYRRQVERYRAYSAAILTALRLGINRREDIVVYLGLLRMKGELPPPSRTVEEEAKAVLSRLATIQKVRGDRRGTWQLVEEVDRVIGR